MPVKYSSYSRICINCAADKGQKLAPIGRVTYKNGYLRILWCNSGFKFVFRGSHINIALGEMKYDDPVYIKITVDNTVYKFAVSTGKERLMIEGLHDGVHYVLVERITEGLTPVLFKSVTLFGSKIVVRPSRVSATKRIEFLGDSLTCGYGVLAEPTVAEYNTYEEDSTRTAAYMAGTAFKADIRTICLSGKGMVCNCNGDRSDHRACNFFKYDDFDGTMHDFSTWQPSLLVINIGTNDAWGAATESEYIDEMRKFAHFVREVYPDTRVLWLCGMLGAQYYAEPLAALIKELGGEKEGYYMLKFEPIEKYDGERGGGGHPNLRAQTRFSKALIRHIHSIMNWPVKGNKDEVCDDLGDDTDAE